MSEPKPVIHVGLIFSTSGSYELVSRAMLEGALLALNEINQSPQYDFTLEATHCDPKGDPARYPMLAESLLADSQLHHIIGCYTSSSRKAIIPAFEKHDALLWYPSHYEGFETSDNVVYTGAAPNQHVVPLMKYVLNNIGHKVYCIGSNYVWAWENNRIVRELTESAGARVVGERYLNVGDCEVDRILRDIQKQDPDFVFNTLIGESSYALYRAFTNSKEANKSCRSAIIGSCSLSEPELRRIGSAAAADHIASSVYFSTLSDPINKRFKKSYEFHYGPGALTSADAEASYNTVYILADSIKHAQSTEILPIKTILPKLMRSAPQGPVYIDELNNHCYLTPRLGVSRPDGQFDIISQESAPVAPDPYLVSSDYQSIIENIRKNNSKGSNDDGACESDRNIRIVRSR